jgi:cyanophycin synthetase
LQGIGEVDKINPITPKDPGVHNKIIELDSRVLVRDGFLGELSYPSLSLSLSVPPEWANGDALHAVNCCLTDALHLEKKPLLTEDDRIESLLGALLYWVYEVQTAAYWPIFETGHVIGVHDQQCVFDMVIPVVKYGHDYTFKIVEWCSEVFNRKFSGRTVAPLLGQLQPLITSLKAIAPKGSNTRKFLKAACELHIPFTSVSRDIYQFGYGHRTRWMSSSFTDETSWLGTSLAQNKFLSTQILREAGLPVPLNRLAGDLKAALSAADELGYPVVVKPVDRDQGIGVAVGLTTPDEVRKAFSMAKRHSEHILVEKHVEGRDYRLVVFRGELIWAIERVPAGVIGDGIRTIGELVDTVNSDPRRGKGAQLSLKSLSLDAEALSLLAKNGMDANSVPKSGESVPLRRIANISAGGMPVGVFDRVHPDNQLLAIRAAALLCLDLAGIDILMPDISRSWREEGAAICEVNAQPQLGSITSSHLYPAILKKYITGNGRIPTMVIVGADPKLPLSATVERELRAAGFRVGRVDDSGVSIAGTAITAGLSDVYTGGNALTCDRSVEAIIMEIHDDRILLSGLPFHRFDVLYLAGSHIKSCSDTNKKSGHELLNTIIQAVLPMCDGEVITLSNDAFKIQSTAQQSPVQDALHSFSFEQSILEVVRALQEADKRHVTPLC